MKNSCDKAVNVGLIGLGTIGCGAAWYLGHGSTWGSLINGLLLVFALSMFVWLPAYVERAGNRYSESFFSALLAAAEKNTKEKINA